MVRQAFDLDVIQSLTNSSNKSGLTESEFNVLYRYYRDDKKTTENQHDNTLDYGSKDERGVVLPNEASKRARAATIWGRFRQLDTSRDLDAWKAVHSAGLYIQMISACIISHVQNYLTSRRRRSRAMALINTVT
jgi:hypothetical protein